jgi:glycerol-3-phosphate dehydrogenase subunit B
MRHDTVVIGAGLAGLTAALRLAEEGQQVLLVAKGVGSTHLGGGTIDVLGYHTERVDSPARALASFIQAHPDHPYARVTPPLIAVSLEWFRSRMSEHLYVGGLDRNVLLPTALGVLKPSAMVPESMVFGDAGAGGRFAIVGFRALKDFYPAYLADNLGRAGPVNGRSVSARSVEVRPSLDGQADVGPLGFARRFEEPAFRKAVIAEVEDRLEPGERVGFPAVLGLREAPAVWREIRDTLGTDVFEIPTLPPSVPGIRVFGALRDALRRAGGRIIMGGAVVGARTEGGRVVGVVVEAAARPISHDARWFVLATGGFASGGLVMDSFGVVRETIFGLPVAGVPGPEEERFGAGYLDPHPMSRAGVAVDEQLRPAGREGEALYANLHAAGATLAGAEPWREKSGDGISLATGYAAASAILEEGV